MQFNHKTHKDEGPVPLDGVKVLSFAQVISAPSAVRMLSDLGAEVIKIEPPTGDVMRRIRPFRRDASGKVHSGIFIALNCGQRSLRLDLARAENRTIAERLILEWADVVVANFSPGTLERFGLGYEAMCAKNPRIIYGLISGYGQTGPWAPKRAYDVCVQSECGLTAQNGPSNGEPHRIGFSVLDYLSGRDLAIGILAALHQRHRDGRGTLVDCSLFTSGVSVLEDAIPGYDMEGVIPVPMGNAHPSASPHGLYRTRDGYVNIIVIDNRLWRRLTDVMGRPDLSDDPRFATPQTRIAHRESLDRLVEEWTGRHSTEECLSQLDAAGLPLGHLARVDEVMAHPVTEHHGMVQTIHQGHLGPVRINGCPIRIGGVNPAPQGPAPDLGEHNGEILEEILGEAPIGGRAATMDPGDGPQEATAGAAQLPRTASSHPCQGSGNHAAP